MKDKVIKSFYENEGFISKNEFKIIELDNEQCKMEYIIKKDGLNPVGIVHGGMLFGLADTAAGALASMSGKFPLTTSSSINYFKSAKGKKIYAIARVAKQGAHMGFFDVNIYNDKDELVCNSMINMYYIEKK